MRFGNYFTVSALVAFQTSTVVARRSAKLFPLGKVNSVDEWDGVRCRYTVNPGTPQEAAVDFPMEFTVPYTANRRLYRVTADEDCNLHWLNGSPPGLIFRFERRVEPVALDDQ